MTLPIKCVTSGGRVKPKEEKISSRSGLSDDESTDIESARLVEKDLPASSKAISPFASQHSKLEKEDETISAKRSKNGKETKISGVAALLSLRFTQSDNSYCKALVAQNNNEDFGANSHRYVLPSSVTCGKKRDSPKKNAGRKKYFEQNSDQEKKIQATISAERRFKQIECDMYAEVARLHLS